jgi:hypothetical protein
MSGADASEYEKKRLARIKENEAALSNLGIAVPAAEDVAAAKAAAKRKAEGLRLARDAPAARTAKRGKPTRESRRLRGHGAEEVDGSVIERSDGHFEVVEEDEEEEADNVVRLQERWTRHVQAAPLSAAEGDAAAATPGSELRRRLFLVPTGVAGVNDHTLEQPVAACDGHYLWGFCEGLFSRIFVHVRVGDILLLTSSGSGSFNRIARVCDKRIVTKATADQFWSRMSFSMGGTSKRNVGFPLLVPLDKPKDVDWDKMEVMKLLGYMDHLQSSRWIKDDKLCTDKGDLVFQRCLTALGLTSTLTKAEVEKNNKLGDLSIPSNDKDEQQA